MANKLKIGSIIHLESSESGWGYLNMLDWTTDIPVITFFKSSAIRAILATHSKKDRVTNSGSWQILSANDEKKPGEDLKSGDKIYLLNMHAGVGYLDTFEHISRLEPFATYASDMKLGVFTANVPNRDGGGSGSWTIHLKSSNSNNSTSGEPIEEGDTIYLENEYPGAGYLFAYANNKESTVPKHTYQKDGRRIDLFKNYLHAKKFVFAGGIEQNSHDHSSYEWKISSVNSGDFAQNLYRIENQWGSNSDDGKTPWHDAGIFKISDGNDGRVVSLTWQRNESSEDSSEGEMPESEETPQPEKKRLSLGKVTFKVEDTQTSYDFKAFSTENLSINHYDVELTANGQTIMQTWVVGSRDSQPVIALSIEAQADKGIAFEGTIQYDGEKKIKIRALEPTEEHPDHDLEYDFYNPDLLRGRAQKMRGVIDTTYKLITNMKDEFKSYTLTSHEKTNVDFPFQEWQLAHLQLLSEKLNGFYTYQLKQLMKEAFKEHRDDQTVVPHHIVRYCFQNLAIDHEIIQRATIQRRWTHGTNIADGAFMSEQAMELLIMDKLAIKALTPFKRLLPIKNNELAIITYLSDKTHIRHMPYTNQMLLVGVSYDRVPQVGILFDDKSLIGEPFHAFELMAIPHEIAHYIYKYGKIELDGKQRTFPEISQKFEGVNPYFKWCEEIFADLYGCIVAGPLTVLSMQALLVSIDRDRAWKDDHDHPTPVLRVFILNEMLRILKDVAEKVFDAKPEKKELFDFQNLPNWLDQNWTTTLEKWGYGDVESLYLSDIFVNATPKSQRPARIYQHDRANIHLDQIVNVDRVLNTVRPIIVEFATYLLSYGDFESRVDSDLENPLQFGMPWVTLDKDKDKDLQLALGRFNGEMRAITNQAFARKTTKKSALNEEISQERPDKSIQDYLEGWGEHGPSGGSGGTHF